MKSTKKVKRMSIYLAPGIENLLKDESHQKGLSINGLINLVLGNYFKKSLKKKLDRDEKRE